MTVNRRIRTCKDCGKRLGSTLVKCHECGGDTYRAGGKSDSARKWKMWLGVDPELIDRAHEGTDFP